MRRAAKLDTFGVDTTNNAYRGAGEKVCHHCGGSFHSYNKARKYCSTKCYGAASVVRPMRNCANCGESFHPNVDGRKYCSPQCAQDGCVKSETIEKVILAAKSGVINGMLFKDIAAETGVSRSRVTTICKAAGIKPPERKVFAVCEHCGGEFWHYTSATRKFCSYKCHLDSGGARRAGDAAVEAVKRYGAKKDANHKEIFDAISRFTAVKDLSAAGFGVPDGLAWVGGGWHLFDVKNPKTAYGKRGLNDRQKRWAEDWRGGPVYLIYSVDEAISFARGDFVGLKVFTSGGVIK